MDVCKTYTQTLFELDIHQIHRHFTMSIVFVSKTG